MALKGAGENLLSIFSKINGFDEKIDTLSKIENQKIHDGLKLFKEKNYAKNHYKTVLLKLCTI